MNLLDRVLQLPQVVDISKFMKEVFDSFDIRNIEDMLIKGNGKLPQMQDLELADAENIALLQGQVINLEGDDALHIMVHVEGLKKARSPQEASNLTSHLHEHQQRQIQAMAVLQQGQGTLFGGGGGGTNEQSGPGLFGGGGTPPQGQEGSAPQQNPGGVGGEAPGSGGIPRMGGV